MNTQTEEERCCCGQLLAMLVEDGIEIKCKRCKRLSVIPLAKFEAILKGQKTVRV